MSNTLAIRIRDFLKNFPPFHILSEQELLSIAASVTVMYVEEGETVFNLGEHPKPHFFVVREGAVGLFTEGSEGKLLINICDEGELFGLRPIVEQDAYRLYALAQEETILYAIPVESILPFMASNKALERFIHVSFRVNIPNGALVFSKEIATDDTPNYFDHQKVRFSENPISCPASFTIMQAACSMAEHRVGSIVIESDKKPLGIVTDKDLRLKVATGKVSIQALVSEIMSSPVITAPATITVAEAQVMMLRHNIAHLCITKDGTPNSNIIGVLSEHDIVALRSNNPYTLVKQIRRSEDINALKSCREQLSELIETYIQQEASMDFVTQVSGAINEALTQQIITLSLREMGGKPLVGFTWLALGSQGRNEQLLLTDQDNALVFEDVPEEQISATKSYFLLLAQKVTQGLADIGYEFCPAEMMASNPQWCLSLSEWKQQFQHWITQPSEESIMLCTIFFDFKTVFGEPSLSQAITQHIFSSIGSFEVFLNYLARNAIQNPAPIGFFRQFIVEKDAQHKNEFDLKSRALMPLIDAARVLVLSREISGKNSTLQRYRALMEIEPQNKALFEACEEAFKVLLRFRTEEGIKKGTSGRYLALETLSKMEKLQLRACFKPLKEIQELLSVRFHLSQIT